MASAFDKRTVIALIALVGLATLAWFTMAADNIRLGVVVLLGFFAFRVLLRSLRDASEARDLDSSASDHEVGNHQI
jgi:fatty acid desaturase